ncbi:tetratricopeptide repeat protein [Hymenobacter artigasi]|uniref:Tetratricopeptide (TPR) repeat protein n=1 Tax=Hymenobacter artigasi TaxID=2719616 RepID=A0ABX1HJK0_9BACT|nr:tetratricopeptide repeat protein [Hymenobacter artigasi]NKI89327.1 tetratricopeptide (TPR) repeat protein [Hymenobacter artigasi]
MLVLFRWWSCLLLVARWGYGGLGRALLLCVLAVLPAAGQIRPLPTKPVALPVLVAAPPADPPAVRVKLFQAAALANSFKDSEALAVYQEILKEVPTHYLALWQAAVLSVKIGARYSDETRKSAYFDLGRQYADRALLLRPEGGESNYAVALALFNEATLYRAGARLRAFSDLRSHVYLATERRPDLPEAWQLRGRWQYRVAHYNIIERLYSKIVLGGVPPGGDSKEAMADLEKARELAPKNLQFCYDLARMYVYQGRRRRAIALLREAERLPTFTSEDLVVSRLCRKMLPPLVRADARRQKRRAREGKKPKPAILAPADSSRARRDTLSRKQ